MHEPHLLGRAYGQSARCEATGREDVDHELRRCLRRFQRSRCSLPVRRASTFTPFAAPYEYGREAQWSASMIYWAKASEQRARACSRTAASAQRGMPLI